MPATNYIEIVDNKQALQKMDIDHNDSGEKLPKFKPIKFKKKIRKSDRQKIVSDPNFEAVLERIV